jgi:uroporphyrinogen-III decarboxylase
MDPWQRFKAVATGGTAGRTPVALIVDSPWIPTYAGLDTLDYFLLPDVWLRENLRLHARFPDVAWIPGFWVEYGMAAEPSAFGAKIVWHHDRPPSIAPVRGGLASLDGINVADPQEDGLMPLALRLYAHASERLAAEGLNVRVVAARGPLAVAAWLLGVSELMVSLKTERDAVGRVLDVLTDSTIAWLRAQADAVGGVEGILLLDDIPGLLSPKLFDGMAAPYLARILEAFAGLVRVYHNDTPCRHLVSRFAELPFEAWNFSHEMDIAEVQAGLPGKALMGNVPPLQVLALGAPGQVTASAQACIEKTGGRGLILSAGGGVSGGTPAENIDALVAAAA